MIIFRHSFIYLSSYVALIPVIRYSTEQWINFYIPKLLNKKEEKQKKANSVNNKQRSWWDDEIRKQKGDLEDNPSKNKQRFYHYTYFLLVNQVGSYVSQGTPQIHPCCQPRTTQKFELN